MDINNRNEGEKKNKTKVGSEFYAFIMIVVSVVLCLVLITGGAIFGGFGVLLINFLLGIFGYSAYPIFIGLLITGILMFMKKKVTMSKRHIIAFSFMLIIGFMCIHLFTTTTLYDRSFGDYISYCFTAPSVGFGTVTGGGVIFGFFVYLIAKAISVVGAYIVLILAFLVTVFFTLDNFINKIKEKRSSNKLSIDKYIDYEIDKATGIQPLYPQNTNDYSQHNNQNFQPQQYGMQNQYGGAQEQRNNGNSYQPQAPQSQPLYNNIMGGQKMQTYGEFISTKSSNNKGQAVPADANDNSRRLFVSTIGVDSHGKKVAVQHHNTRNETLSILHADMQGIEGYNQANCIDNPISKRDAMTQLYGAEKSYIDNYEERTKEKFKSDQEIKAYIMNPPDLSDVYGDILNNTNQNQNNGLTRQQQQQNIDKPQRVLHEPTYENNMYSQPPQTQSPYRTYIPPQNNTGQNLPYVEDNIPDAPNSTRRTSYSSDTAQRTSRFSTPQPTQPTTTYTKSQESVQPPAGLINAPSNVDDDTSVEKVVDFDKYREKKNQEQAQKQQQIFTEPAKKEEPKRVSYFDGEDNDSGDSEDVLPPEQLKPRVMPPTIKPRNVGGYEQIGIETIENEPTAVSFNSVPSAINPITGGTIIKKPVVKYPKYIAPPIDLIERRIVDTESNNDAVIENGRILESTLHEFGIQATVSGIVPGPTVTRYEVSMPHGVKVKRVSEIADDIALRLAAKNIRIEAPIQGKSLVGIEVPNSHKQTVGLREVFDSNEFMSSTSPLTFAIGKDVAGNNMVERIDKMPHLLVAGATGTGKSVCLNTLIVSLLYKASPEDLRLILVDPKSVEFTTYNGLPHMLIPSAITEPDKAMSAFNWAISEMERRYALFREMGARDVNSYHQRYDPETDEKLPYIVIIVDEFNDLMMASKGEIEDKIIRLAQKSRAAGIHLVLATQRPTVDVISGTIKANLPCKIALTVGSYIDSKTILDVAGAETLLGHGDMLYKTPQRLDSKRLQGAFVTDREVENIVEFIKENNTAFYDAEIEKSINAPQRSSGGIGVGGGNAGGNSEDDRLIVDVLPLMIRANKATVNFVQTKLGIGYPRASRLIDIMEERGYVTQLQANEPRQVKITMDEYNQLFGSK